MNENIRRPLDRRRSAEFNPKAIRPRPNVFKTKITSNIQTIELNIFNNFFQKEMFETFKQAKFGDEQLIKYFFFQFQFHIITKCGFTSTIAFHK
jgi:hypothetical protein